MQNGRGGFCEWRFLIHYFSLFAETANGRPGGRQESLSEGNVQEVDS